MKNRKSSPERKSRWLPVAALMAIGATALTSCGVASGERAGVPERPETSTSQIEKPNADPTPSAHEQDASVELDSSPESIRANTVQYADDMFTHHGSSEAPQAAEDLEFGGIVYSYNARAEKSSDDFDCTTMVSVSAGRADNASIIVNNKCVNADGSLFATQMEFLTYDVGTINKLSATTTDKENRMHPAMSREELLDMMKYGARGEGALTPEVTNVTSWGPGGKGVKTVRVEADSSVSRLDKQTSDQKEIKDLVVDVFGGMRNKAFGKELPAEAPNESPAPQESPDIHEDNENEKTLQEMRAEQLRSVSVVFKKYGPEKLEGGEAYIATAFGGGCTSRIGVNIMDGKTSVNTSTVCDDRRFSFTGRSEYSSSNPADIAELMQPMTPGELIEGVKKFEHDRTETELRDKVNSTNEKFEDTKDGLVHTYPSPVLGGPVTDRGEQVNPNDMLEHAAGVSAAADAA